MTDDLTTDIEPALLYDAAEGLLLGDAAVIDRHRKPVRAWLRKAELPFEPLPLLPMPQVSYSDDEEEAERNSVRFRGVANYAAQLARAMVNHLRACGYVIEKPGPEPRAVAVSEPEPAAKPKRRTAKEAA